MDSHSRLYREYMAYVPGYEDDVFLSYAMADDRDWVAAFEENLRETLGSELGSKIRVWQDVKSIRVAEDWQNAIEEGIEKAAAFVAIVSPSYRASNWCSKERTIFLNQFCSKDELGISQMPCLDKMKIGNMFRFFKVIKVPWENDQHSRFLPRLQHTAFYRGKEDYAELVPGADDYRREMRKTVLALAGLLRNMRSQKQKLFIACPSADIVPICEKLRSRLHDCCYNVRPVAARELDFTMQDLVPTEIEGAAAAVFLLGPEYDPFVKFQLQETVRLGVRPFVWLLPGAAERAAGEQAKLIESVRKMEGLPATTRLLPESNENEMINAVLGLLHANGQAAAPAAAAGGAGQGLYLICDPTDGDDRTLAERWRSEIEDQEGITVSLPSRKSYAERHEQLLRQCDGVLLLQKSAPLTWLKQNALDVCAAEQLYRRPPLRSKCFLLNDTTPYADYPVQLLSEPSQVDLARIEPFLAPLRQARDQHAGN